MNKFSNYILFILLTCLSISCYDDLGNYDYHEINVIKVDSLRSQYECDMYDSLHIQPLLQGSMYSDTSRFTYEWEIDGEIMSTQHDLHVYMDLNPGMKYSRFIVKDKDTGVKKYAVFNVNVSSSTAGDMIMVLSKYQGRAELSYLRLDKPSSWCVNYYKDRIGKSLGTDPQQLSICYLEGNKGAPFVDKYGRVMALVDNKINLICKNTLLPDSIEPILKKEAYLRNVSFPAPNIERYHSEFVCEGIDQWRFNSYGKTPLSQVHNMQISAGRLYDASLVNKFPLTCSYKFNRKSPYTDGEFAPFGYYEDMSDDPSGTTVELGYNLGDFVLYDQIHCRFAFAGSWSIYSSNLNYLPAFPGYNLMWGAATSRPNNTSIAVLNNEDDCQVILIGKQKRQKAMLGRVHGGSTMSSNTHFHMMRYVDYLLYATGTAVYKYNIHDIDMNIQPNETNKIFDLKDLGYADDAVITDICVSRTEKTLILGVSRYGDDNQGNGDEIKGDVVVFDLDPNTLTLNYNPGMSTRGISGIPVDIQIKYQTHFRYGLDRHGILQDNI